MLVFAQSVLMFRYPKVKVTIEMKSNVFNTGDSVKFRMILLNNTDTIQKLLFDKPAGKLFPWGTSVVLKSASGRLMVEFSNREMLSSQIYSEEQIEKYGYYYLLTPGQSLSHEYYLPDIAILKTRDGKLPVGEYRFQISYYLHFSNSTSFSIK